MFSTIIEEAKKQGHVYLTIVIICVYLYFELDKYKAANNAIMTELRDCEVENADLRARLEQNERIFNNAYEQPVLPEKKKRKRKDVNND